ncbi:MAG: hypothetical protein M0R32_02715 [Candidatus Cloacimonetes bacterium]|jgi:hypothetical protein|nr:hypothetical protein [Candidatus Cloacimonadota bacterium]
MIAKEILHLNEDQRITSLFVDDKSNCILIGLSDGRIIKADRSVINAYATGKRTISAIVEDSYGYISNEAIIGALYLFRNAVLKLDERGIVTSTWNANVPYSAKEESKIEGVFTSIPLWAGEDFILWKDLIWEVNNPEGTQTKLQIRTAESRAELESSDWKTFDASNGQNSVSLDSFGNKGEWLQLRAVLTTSSKNSSPVVANVAVSYRTKFSVYFYTTKFIMERGSNLESGLLIANMETPRNTEVKIGINDKNSGDWDGYQIIDPDKIFQIEAKDSERIKIGFKMISYSEDAFATIDEFSVLLGGEKMEILRVN